MVRSTMFAALLVAACSGGGSAGNAGGNPGGGGPPAASPLLHAATVSAEQVGNLDATAFPDGSTLVAGEVGGRIVLDEGGAGETTVPDLPTWTLLLAKYDPDGALAWFRTVQTNGGNGISCVALPDGSSVIAGDMVGVAVFGRGEPNETLIGDTGGEGWTYLARHAADGTLLWAKAIPGAQTRGIASLPDSSFVICGDFREATFAAGQPLNSWSQQDIFAAKYAASGSLLWVARAGGAPTGSQRGAAVAAAPDGGCVVTGYVRERCVFDSADVNHTVLTTPGDGAGGFYVNPFVARFGPNGSLAWARKIDCAAHVSAFAVAAFPDGSSAIAGRLNGTPAVFGPAEIAETELLGPGLYVARYSPAGDLAWAREVLSPSAFDQQGSVAASADGSVLVTGTFWTEARAGIGDPNETLVVADQGAFLARYGMHGTLDWAGREARAYWSAGRAVAPAADDAFVWVGSFDQGEGLSLEDATFPPRAGSGLWMARFRE